jgi:hypothetical protein
LRSGSECIMRGLRYQGTNGRVTKLNAFPAPFSLVGFHDIVVK